MWLRAALRVHGPDAGAGANVQYALRVRADGGEVEAAVHGQVADVVADIKLVSGLFIVGAPVDGVIVGVLLGL